MASGRTAARLAAAAGLQMTVEFRPSLTREDRRSLALHEVIASERCHASK